MTHMRLSLALLLALACLPWEAFSQISPVRLRSIFEFVDLDQADMKVPAFAAGVSLRADVDESVASETWKLELFAFRRGLVQRFTGTGRPPRSIRWHGVAQDGSLTSNSFYTAQLRVTTPEGETLASEIAEVHLVKPVELTRLENHNLSFAEDVSNIIIRLPKLTYSPGRSEFSPEVSEALDAVAEYLKRAGDKKILVLGFTDPTGSPERNRALSVERARRVYTYLASQGGFAWEQMRFGGMKDSRPIADNSTEQGRERNRRVEIWVQKA